MDIGSDSQTVYLQDLDGNFFKLVVISGDIFRSATFEVHQKIGEHWFHQGTRESTSGIKKGKSLWDGTTIDSYVVTNPI